MKQIKRGVIVLILLCLVVALHSIYSYAYAGSIKDKIQMDEMVNCNEAGSLVKEIQMIRFTEKTKEWDFMYKHSKDIKGIPPEKLWQTVKDTYALFEDNMHPSAAYRDTVVRCSQYYKAQKLNIEFEL